MYTNRYPYMYIIRVPDLIEWCSDVHAPVLLCSGEKCFGQHFSQVYIIWIRASNRFELKFNDRYTFWSRVTVKNLVSIGQ